MQKLFENWRRYLSEDQLLKEERITKYILESDIENLWENENYERLDEDVKDWLETAAHAVLDVVGVGADLVGAIPVGIAADAINMAWYAKKGCYLYAAFSAISILPAVGDLIGKGGKLISYLKVAGDTAKKVGLVIRRNRDKIDNAFEALENSDKTPDVVRNAIPKMKEALQVFAVDPSKPPPPCGADEPPINSLPSQEQPEETTEEEPEEIIDVGFGEEESI